MKKLHFLLVLIFLFSFTGQAQGDLITVYFVDVGQGDSTLIICDDDVMLVDTGPSSGWSTLYDLLEENNVDEIDYLVLTHPHDDHDANIGLLAAYFPINHLVMPEYADDEEDYGSLLREMVADGTRIIYPNVGDQFLLGDAITTVLSATNPRLYPNDKNLWSIVLRIDSGEVSVMLTGDSEDINEYAMIDAALDLDVDVLSVGHHGGYTSSSMAFISATSPEYAVISCGLNNSYGHPHRETLGTLTEHQVNVLRTDLHGTIRLTSDGLTYTISQNEGNHAEDPQSDIEQAYILNRNSKKFHYPNCPSVGQMKEKNKVESAQSRNEIIDQGYSPCGNCKP